MKRITAALTALAVVIGLGTSCQKEMESRQEISGNGTGLKVTATIADNGTKMSYQEDNTDYSLQPGWEVDDILIGFDGNDDSKTYGYKVTEINEGAATLAIITDGDYVGTSASDPADGTTMYMFYAPGTKPSAISGKSLTVSIASQAKDTVPTLMMAQATVANGSLSLSFTNETAIIGVKAPVMADKNKKYTSLSLSGSTGLNTAVTFSLDGDKNLTASYQTFGTLTKALDFTSDSETGKGQDVIYIVACPAAEQDLSFKFNGTEEYFNVKNVEIEANNYYRLEAPGTAKQKFTVTVAEDITGGTITTSPSDSVAWGDTVTVTATPSEGYELDTLTYNDGSDHAMTDSTFTMPQADVTVSGSFQLKDYDITAETATGGTYTVQSGSPLADVTTARMGDSIIVTPSPETGYSGGTVTVKKTGTEETVTFDATTNTFVMPAAGVTISVTFENDPVFSVGSETKVLFAPGNLYAKKDDDNWTWGFYDEQYKFHPDSMEKISTSSSTSDSRTAASEDTEIDLFTWGYDNNSSKNPVSKTGIGGHNSDGDRFTTNEDWGSITGLPIAPYSGGWRTLSKDEWNYLLNTRTGISTVSGTANARYLKCKVNDGERDVYGLMIFPDEFTWPSGAGDAPTSGINTSNWTWNKVSRYTKTQFEALEEAGVVFLPAAGWRYNGTSVRNVGYEADYWSSTSGRNTNAYYMTTTNGDIWPASSTGRNSGYSVRLVSDVQ